MSDFFIRVISTVGNATLTLTGAGKRSGGLVPNEFVAVKSNEKALLREAAVLQVEHTVATSRTAVGLASTAPLSRQEHLRDTDTAGRPSMDELLVRFCDWTRNTDGLHPFVIEDLLELRTPPAKAPAQLRAWLRMNGKMTWVGLFANP